MSQGQTLQPGVLPDPGPPGIPKLPHALHRQRNGPGTPEGLHRRLCRGSIRRLAQKGQRQVQHLPPGKAAPAQAAQLRLGRQQGFLRRRGGPDRRKEPHRDPTFHTLFLVFHPITVLQ